MKTLNVLEKSDVFVLCWFQLEDDVVAKTGYYSDMKTFVSQVASDEWLYLEFSQLGFIGVHPQQ